MTESFKKKLQDFAPEPPKSVWEGIVSRLNDSPVFADKLAGYEATPPAGAWKAIVQQLDQKEKEPLVRIIRPNRYAAAAILLIVAGITYFSLFQQEPVQAITTTQAVSPVPFPNSNPAPPVSVSSGDNDIARQPSPADKSEEAYANQDKKQTALAHLSGEPDHHIPESALGFADENSDKLFIPSHAAPTRRLLLSPTADRYMVYSDGQGNAMRLPRHMFDYVACITNELDCKKRIAQLRSKAAAITMSTDFSGVLEMLAKLDETK